MMPPYTSLWLQTLLEMRGTAAVVEDWGGITWVRARGWALCGEAPPGAQMTAWGWGPEGRQP